MAAYIVQLATSSRCAIQPTSCGGFLPPTLVNDVRKSDVELN